MPNNVAGTTPWRSDCAGRILTAARLYCNSPPESPMSWEQFNPNNPDYHSDPMEICSTLWIRDFTHVWRNGEETHSRHADLSNVWWDIFCIIPHCVGVEASVTLGRDVIGWRPSTTTGESLLKHVFVRKFAQPNNWILGGDDPALDMTNTANAAEMKRQAQAQKLDRIAKVHNILEMWQGSENVCATQRESCAQNKQMWAVGYILDTEEIVKASWSLCQHDCAAAFKLLERSPFQLALCAKDHAGARTQVSNVRRIRSINRHPVEIDKDSQPKRILYTENWLNWNGDLDNPNDSESDRLKRCWWWLIQ